jgi:RNA polymerase sigma-70 factor (ECF subfamily)
MDDQELIKLVRNGDQAAFETLMSRYKDKIVNYLYQVCGDYQKAMELGQETFIRVYFKADKYQPIAPLSSWIYAIATNLARSEARRNMRKSAVSLDDIPNEYLAGTYSEDRADSGLVRNLRQALDELSPRYRVPVVLKDLEGFSQEEIAAMLKKPVGTIKARISRGRMQLRKKLEKALGEGDKYSASEVIENGRA